MADPDHINASRQDTPSIAVVIPCWNAKKWVGHAIQSILDQDYKDLDIVVIDDGSTDGSLDIIKSFGSKVRWESWPNRGACAARNRGVAITQTDFVFFLDADDYIEGEFLAGLSQAMRETGAQLAIGPTLSETEKAIRSIRAFGNNSTKAQLIGSTIRFNGVSIGTVLWKRDFFNSIGGWDTQLLRLQDYFLNIVALSRCSHFTMSQSGAFVIREHSSPGRISERRDPNTECSVICAFQKYISDFEAFLLAEDRLFLAKHLYSIALQLYRWDHKREAEIGFALSRRLGLRGHAGNLRHRLACAVLGLERKERLSDLKRSIRLLESL